MYIENRLIRPVCAQMHFNQRRGEICRIHPLTVNEVPGVLLLAVPSHEDKYLSMPGMVRVCGEAENLARGIVLLEPRSPRYLSLTHEGMKFGLQLWVEDMT